MQDRSTIIGVIDMRAKGYSYLDVQGRYRIGSGTITRIMKIFEGTDATLDELRRMAPDAVVDLFFPPERRRRKNGEPPDFAKVHERMLNMGKRADLSIVWMDYIQADPDGYRLSQFYKLYGEYLSEIGMGRKTSMPVERDPSQKIFIDWPATRQSCCWTSRPGRFRRCISSSPPWASAATCTQERSSTRRRRASWPARRTRCRSMERCPSSWCRTIARWPFPSIRPSNYLICG